MILVRYDSGKMLRRAAAFGLLATFAFGSFFLAIVGLFLLANVAAILNKALRSNVAAIARTDTGFTVATLWSSKHISFEDYRGLAVETISYRLLVFPVKIASNLVIESKGLIFNKKSRVSIGFVDLEEADVPALKAVMEKLLSGGSATAPLAAPQGRLGALRMPAPSTPATVAANGVPTAPRKGFGGRAGDPLEGAPRGDLMNIPAGGFGRKGQ